MNLNKIIAIATLVADAEMRYASSGTAITEFRCAINGREDKDTVYVDVKCFGKIAEIVAQHKKKGDSVVLDGRLAMDQWEDKTTGQKRSKIYVIAESVQFIGGKKDGGEKTSQAPQQKRSASKPQQRQAPRPEEDLSEEIPF